MNLDRMLLEDQGVRIAYSPGASNGGQKKACVFMPSGHRTLVDDCSGECELFSRIRQSLITDGYASFEIDLPPKCAISEYGDVIGRSNRLRQLVRSPLFQEFRNDFAILGISLGGHATLNYLALDEPDNPVPKFALLCSTVVDYPLVINSPILCLSFLYGANDCIAYTNEVEGPVRILRAEEYSLFAERYLVVMRRQMVIAGIEPDVGHLFGSKSRSIDDIAGSIAQHFFQAQLNARNRR